MEKKERNPEWERVMLNSEHVIMSDDLREKLSPIDLEEEISHAKNVDIKGEVHLESETIEASVYSYAVSTEKFEIIMKGPLESFLPIIFGSAVKAIQVTNSVNEQHFSITMLPEDENPAVVLEKEGDSLGKLTITIKLDK
jgi:hypothetical protein